jgi:hypothetical protein
MLPTAQAGQVVVVDVKLMVNKVQIKKKCGTCNDCGKFGHKKSNYWALEAHKNKRPKNYRGTLCNKYVRIEFKGDYRNHLGREE